MRNIKLGQVLKNICFLIFTVIFLAGCIANSPYNSPWAVPYPTNDKENLHTQEQRPVINWRTHQKRESLHVYYDQSRIEREKYYRENYNRATNDYQSQYSNQNAYSEHNYTHEENIQDLIQNTDGKEIVVALLLPMSGKYKSLGKSMMNAAQMALFDLDTNAFKLLPKDTKGTEEGARKAALEALEAGADLVLGPVFSKNAKIVKSVLSYTDIPMITYTTDWKLAGNNTYVMGFLPFSQVIRVVNYAYTNGYKKIGFFGTNNDYSNIVLRTLHYSLKRHGEYIAKTGSFSVGQPDLHMIVQDFIGVEIPDETEPGANTEFEQKEAINLDFDAVFIPVGGQALKTVTNMFAYYNVDSKMVKFLGTGLWDDKNLVYEQSLHGSWFAAPDPSLRADFEKRYQENYGEKPKRLASLAYDSLALAIVLAKTYNGVGEPYAKNRLVTQQGFAGIDGIFRFRQDNLVERGLAVLEITPNGLKVIDKAPDAFFSLTN